MQGKFGNYEPRYHYGLYLLQNNRREEASTVFTEMIAEEKHLGPRERRIFKPWIQKAKAEMKAMTEKV